MKRYLLSLGFILACAFFGYGQTQQIFWRSEASSGEWFETNPCGEIGFANSQWFYPHFGPNPARNAPNCFGIYDLLFDNNHELTMNNSGVFFEVNRITFEAGNTNTRTLNGEGVDLINEGANRPIIRNLSSAVHIINIPIAFLNSPVEFNPIDSDLTFTNNIFNNGNFLDVFGDNGNKLTLSGDLQGAGGIALKQNSTIEIAGNMTYTGGTAIEGGTFRLLSGGNLSDETNVTISNGATFDLNSQDVTVRSVSETGTSNGGSISLGSGTLTINGGYSTDRFQNSISGDGNLVKNGSGLLSLYGTQSYTGTTTVNGGLLASGSQMLTTSLNVNNGGRFDANIVNTIVQSASVDVASGGEIRFNANQTLDNLSVSGTLFVADGVELEVLNNFTTDSATITGGGTINVIGVWTNSAGTTTIDSGTDAIFKSTTATTTAQYGNSTGTITGDVTLERFIPAKRAFRLLSSAVSGVSIANAWQQQTHITGVGGAINGFDPTTTNNPSMFTFDNSLVDQSGGQAWEAIANTNATNLNAGTPYRLLVRGSRSTVDLTDNESPSSDVTLSAKGTLAAGSLATGTDLPAMATLSEQHSFIGNPYQAVVDATALNYNGDVNSNYIYVWDAKIGGVNGRGGFVIVDTTTGDPVTDPLAPPPGTSQANQFIMPGQAFFIRNNEIINTPPSITFTEAAKATGEQQIEVFSTSSEVYLNLSLYTQESWDANDYESDAFGIRWSPNYTTLVSDEDSGKLGNPGENFAVNNSNTLVGIEKRNLPESEELIPLFINNYEEEDYVIHNQFENLPEDAKFYIIDDYLETTTELVNGEAYNYSIDASIPASLVFNRFSIRFEPTTLSQTDFTENNFSLYPNPAENQLNINWNSVPNEDTQITIFNLVGQKVAEFTSNASLKTTSLPIQNLNAGMYILQIQSSDINTSRKFIKR